VYRFRQGGERRMMGLGSIRKISLSDARKAATAAKAQADKGTDPIEDRGQKRAEWIAAVAAKKAARAKPKTTAESNTFVAYAERYITNHEAAWKRGGSAYLWRNPFKKWIYPEIGDKDIAEIGLKEVVAGLSKAWIQVPETARRMRARIERIFDAAIAVGAYQKANPATIRLVATQLPKAKRTIVSFRAATLEDAPGLFQRIIAADGTAYAAHGFMILTTARPSEALRATWSEIDMSKKLWTIPAERMKAGKAHQVPLTDAALAILERQAQVRVNEFVFPGQKADAPLSYDCFAKALIKIGITEATPHSFRSTFRDFCGDIIDCPREVAEAQLAHRLDATEGAYRRGTAVEKRRGVLKQYAARLDGDTGQVVQFPPATVGG
jgi:integrase